MWLMRTESVRAMLAQRHICAQKGELAIRLFGCDRTNLKQGMEWAHVDREGRADHLSQSDASEPISTKCGRARLGTHRSRERGELVTDSLSGEPEPISRSNARILAGHHKGSRQADKTAKGWALTAVAMQAQEGRREKDEKLTLHTAAQLISRTLMNDVDYR